MRVAPFFRGLAAILAIAAIFLGGCRSQTPRFYTLSPIPEDQVISKRQNPAQNAVIGIGPVKTAEYLDESLIVTRTNDNELKKGQFNRWVGSFKDNFINVLADDIGFLVPTERIYLYPWRLSVPIDYQVTVDIVRCDGRLGDAAWLEARWSIFQGPEKKLLKMNRSSIREPVTGPDYAGLVAAQSRAVAKLSQQIAAAIQGAGKK
ncbi:MAG: PqiC family protein [Desulfobaccales bacterium]